MDPKSFSERMERAELDARESDRRLGDAIRARDVEHNGLRDELQRRAERMTRQVCDVRLGDAPTRAEVERLDYLRARLGMDWDAINRRWTSYEAEG